MKNGPAQATDGDMSTPTRLDDGPPPALEILPLEGGSGLRLIGELDMSTAPALSTRLAEIMVGRPETVLLDLSELTFIDSSGIHAIVNQVRGANARAPIILASPTRQVARALQLVGLVDRFPGIVVTEDGH